MTKKKFAIVGCGKLGKIVVNDTLMVFNDYQLVVCFQNRKKCKAISSGKVNDKKISMVVWF